MSRQKIIKTNFSAHRKRIKDKVIQHGAENLSEYELLEMLLFLSIPMKDAKYLSKHIIESFGSFAEFINASDEKLAFHSTSQNIIFIAKIVREAISRCLSLEIRKDCIVSNWQALTNYCRQRYGILNIEKFIIIFLNSKNYVIDDWVISVGTVDQTQLYTREIIKKAFDLFACSVILVHNHPSDYTTPSEEDVSLTKEIVRVAQFVGIEVHDHIVISKAKSFFSFKKNGLI